MRSAQELFETVVLHCRKQGEKAHVKLGEGDYSCRYRDPMGRKCAIGCLIPDDVYKPAMEGGDVGDIIAKDLLPLSLAAEFYKNLRLLSALQKVHDQSNTFADWERQWRMVAEDFKLRYPKP
jgi:hypothetical protein